MSYYAIDLFSGAGGLSAGLESAGFKIAYASDINADMCKTYQYNHPNTVVDQRDISELTWKNIKESTKLKKSDIKLISGGPPCQGFSTVGKKDESDPRNKLFVQYVRIIREVNSDFVIFENVSGFKKLYQGRAFEAVCKEFRDLGYTINNKILNAINYGVPQHRERTFIIAHSKKLKFSWPKKTHGTENKNDLFNENLKKPLTLEDALGDLPLVESGKKNEHYSSSPKNSYQKKRRKNCNHLTEHVGPRHGESLLYRIKLIPKGGSVLDLPEQLRPKSYFNNTYARLLWDKPATTITRNFSTPSSSRCIHPFLNRGLTTREGARLQSFDDDYVFFGKSKSSKNLQIGNAVPPLLAHNLGREIMSGIKRKEVTNDNRPNN